MESKTYIKNLKISPKKLRMIAPAVKKLSPARALETLVYMPKKGAKVLHKAIVSALSNAKNTLKVDLDKLKFKTLLVEEGQRMKRFRAGGRGMARPYRRQSSHIKIVLEVTK